MDIGRSWIWMLVPATIIILGVVLSGAFSGDGNRDVAGIIDRKRPAAADTERTSSPPVARLNGAVITRSDVLNRKAIMDSVAGVSPATHQRAFDALVMDRLLHDEAKRRGLAASTEEAVALARSHQRMYADRTLPDYEQVQATIKSLGVDEKTYWERMAPEQYAMVMSIAALRGSLGAPLAPGGASMPDVANQVLAQTRSFERLTATLLTKARLQILDRDFLKAK